MEFYKGEKTLEYQIIRPGHTFIYGADCDYRTAFLKGIEEQYPVRPNNDRPVALYVDQLGFQGNMGLGNEILTRINQSYMDICIAIRILERTLECNTGDFSGLIDAVNRLFTQKRIKIETLKQLLEELKKSQMFYREGFYEWAKGGRLSFDEIAIRQILLDSFVKYYKEDMNMRSHFALIYDNKGQLSELSTRLINNLIGSRIIGWLSTNVATSPDNWKSYYTTYDKFVADPHDYTTVDLGESSQKVLEQNKNNKV